MTRPGSPPLPSVRVAAPAQANVYVYVWANSALIGDRYAKAAYDFRGDLDGVSDDKSSPHPG